MAKARRTITAPPSVEQPLAEPVAPQSASDTTATDVDRERISRRAYELYVARGGADGQDLEDWLAAERELIQ